MLSFEAKAIKKKDLEIVLEEIPPHPKPKARLEQYVTSASVAADILFLAYSRGDIQSKIVLDLGCGTGIFTLGACLLQAAYIHAVDLDEDALKKAKKIAQKWGCENITFYHQDINDFDKKGDTVLMNPPFGSQKKGADRPFLKKAVDTAPNIYSLHNSKSVDFVKSFLQDLGYKIEGEKRYMLEIDRQFNFHSKPKKYFEAMLLISKRNEDG